MKRSKKYLAVGILSLSVLTACSNNAVPGGTTVETTSTVASGETTTASGETTTASGETTVSGEQPTSYELSIPRETVVIEPLSDYSEYLTLGQYKGIEVPKITITDEQLEERLATMFHDTVQNGDSVVIDYEGLKDGVAFEGGTASDYTLAIGSGSFIPGFEEGLIGAKAGDKVALDITFPEDYSSADLAGQPVVFNVTIKSISNVSAPELNEDYVKNNTEFTTIEEYKQSIRDTMVTEKENERLSTAWESVQEAASVIKYPENEVNNFAAEMLSSYEQMATSYQMDLASIVSMSSGMTLEQFEQECISYGQTASKQSMILREIARLENITITDEEFKAEMAKAMEQSGSTEEEILNMYGGEALIRESILFNEVIMFIEDNFVEV